MLMQFDARMVMASSVKEQQNDKDRFSRFLQAVERYRIVSLVRKLQSDRFNSRISNCVVRNCNGVVSILPNEVLLFVSSGWKSSILVSSECVLV